MLKTLISALILSLGLMATSHEATAQQGQFSPRVLVDNMVVTNYEFDQRMRFMTLLNVQGDIAREAEQTLIDDRLRMIAGQRAGVRLTEAQIMTGMEEFVGRFDMELDQFITIIEANGVARETFRDFVRAGLIWREVVRARFGPMAPTLVSEADIDRHLSVLVQQSATRVLLSEITLPTDGQKLAQEISEQARSEAAFAGLARQHSTAPSAADGGRRDWVAVTSLPPAVATALEAAGQGKATAPVQIPTGWAVYFLRRIEQATTITPALTAIDYSIMMLPEAGSPATQASVADILARTDRCNDLNRWAKGQPEGTVTRETVAASRLPADIAAEIERLDDNEISTRLTRGGAQVVLMLCSRRVLSDKEPSREAVRARLTEDRFGMRADHYLQELRANAHIRKP